MADTKSINAKLDAMLESIANVAADVAGLKGAIVPGMSQADVDALGLRIDTIAQTLSDLAASTPDAPPA